MCSVDPERRNPPIGGRLRDARERARMTQAQVAKWLGVSRKAVSDWENDRAYPMNSIGALEELFDIVLRPREPDSAVPRSLREGFAAAVRRGEMTRAEAADAIAALEEMLGGGATSPGEGGGAGSPRSRSAG